MPALNVQSKCLCAYGGIVTVTNPVATTTAVP
jgi:hypothetical protein